MLLRHSRLDSGTDVKVNTPYFTSTAAAALHSDLITRTLAALQLSPMLKVNIGTSIEYLCRLNARVRI